MNKKIDRLLYAIIAVLCVAIVLSAVLIPLYFTGIIGKGLDPIPAKEKTEVDPIKGKEFKSVSAKSLPKGQYADFTILYSEKQYTVKVYLLTDYAPITVQNFIDNVQKGLYDNTVFYKSDVTYYKDTGEPSSAYLQGGTYVTDVDGNLVRRAPSDPVKKIKGEFYANDPNSQNNISFTGGVLGMVRDEGNDAAAYNSADTEFFFLPYAHSEYNGYYAAFGITVESDDNTELFTFARALKEADGDYPVLLQKVKVYSR